MDKPDGFAEHFPGNDRSGFLEKLLLSILFEAAVGDALLAHVERLLRDSDGACITAESRD